MILAELQREAHGIAKSKGWWDEERTFGELIALVHSELSRTYQEYRNVRLEGSQPPYDGEGDGVAGLLADVVIRVADMAEHYDWDLSGWEDADISHPIVDPTFGDWICLIHASLAWAFAGLCTTLQRSEWIEPLKAALRLVNDMAAHYGIDLDAAIEAKMEYNRTRSYRHGGKAL